MAPTHSEWKNENENERAVEHLGAIVIFNMPTLHSFGNLSE